MQTRRLGGFCVLGFWVLSAQRIPRATLACIRIQRGATGQAPKSIIEDHGASIIAVSCSVTRMKTLLIVFSSRTDGTRQMAEAAYRGAASEGGMHVRLVGKLSKTAGECHFYLAEK